MLIDTEKTLPRRPSRSASGFYLLMTLLIAGSLMGIIHVALLEEWYGEGLIVRASFSLPASWTNREVVWLGDFRCDQNPSSLELDQWKSLLRRHRIRFSTIKQVPEGPIGVLILPSAECLAPADRGALRRWLAGGGGIVATAWPGRHEAGGRGESSDFAAEVFGLQLQQGAAKESNWVTLTNEFPLGIGLAPGQSWQIEEDDATHALGSVSAGYWSNNRYRTSAYESTSDPIAITYRRLAQGRLVWIGPGLRAVSTQSPDRSSWEKLFLNSLRWSGRETLAGLSYWPSGSPSAAIFAGEVRSQSDLRTAVRAAGELGKLGLPSTLFVDPKLLDLNGNIDQLDRQAEIAVLLDTDGAGGAWAGALSQVAKKLDLKAGRGVTGLRAKGAYLSPGAREDLARLGFTYQLTSASLQKSAPEIWHSLQSALFPLDRRNFVVLPQTARDDFAVLSQYDGAVGSTAGIADFLKQDFERVERTRGLYVLNYRMDLLGSDQIRPAIVAFAKHLRDQRTWVASAAEVAQWWIALERIEVHAEKVSPRRIRITVRNSGDRRLEGLTVLVGLPHAPSAAKLHSTVFWAEPASLHLNLESEQLQLCLPRIKPQSTSTWLVDLY